MTRNRYENLSDEELVRLGRAGDPEAVDHLLVKYKPLVLKLSSKRFLVGADRDDLLQEGMIGLYKAVRDYDPHREARFSSFAALCIDRQMLHAIGASGSKKNRALNSSIPLADGDLEHAASREGDSPESIVIGQEVAGERLKRLREILSPLERKVLRLYLTGLDYREIADTLDRTPKAIDNAFQRIRRKTASIR